jgi:tetratricopeptide (TPR) repeat protein
VALRALHRFADDIDDRIFTILMEDRDITVAQSAYEIVRDTAFPLMTDKFRSALTAGDCGAVLQIAERIRDYLGPMSSRFDQICDDAAQRLNTGDREQCVAAMLALAILNPTYDSIGGWEQFSHRVRAAFHRNGLQATWHRLAQEAESLSDTNRKFVYLVVAAFEQELEPLASLVSWATEIWPDDIGIMAASIAVDIRRSNRQQALERLFAEEERFVEHIGHFWLGDRFAELDHPQDALRHYRLWAEREPANAEAHFRAGWFAFVTGDLKGSIDSTRCSLTLKPIRPMAEFNLGLALLARRDIGPAEIAYRRGVALARRQTPTDALQAFDGAIGDFALLPELPDDAMYATDRIRSRLQDECNLLRS